MEETTKVCLRPGCTSVDITRRFEKGFPLLGKNYPDAVQVRCRKCKYGWLERVPSARKRGQRGST